MLELICCFCIAAIAAADQLIKLAVLDSSLVSGEIYTVIDGILQFRYVENTGAAFSLFTGKTAMLSVFTAVVLLVGFYLICAKKIKSKIALTSIVMLMGGGLGNLIDRVFRHFVVDYIEVLFVDFPVFNFADCFVTVGEFILVGYLIYDLVKDFRKAGQNTDGE